MANQQKPTSNPLGNFGLIAVGILVLVALYFIAKVAFNLIYWAAIPLFIATLVIDHKVVLNYGKWILNLFKTNPLYGIGASVVTFFGYPVVSLFLFVKAFLMKKVKDVSKQFEEKKEGDYVEYEELPTGTTKKQAPPKKQEPAPEEKLIELPPIKQKQKEIQTNKNEYEDLFGE